MIPRQPYRSPFWRPDPAADDAARPVVRTTRAGPHEEFAARPVQRVAAKRQAAPAGNGHGGYLAADLALFETLTPSGERLQARPAPAIEARAAPSRAGDTGRPDRGRSVRLPEQRYSAADDALFATLQAGFSHVRNGGQPGGQPQDAGSAALSHGYSQDDLEAFERLTRFGPSR